MRANLILACCLAVACAPASPEAANERRGVLVVAVDCMRADRMSLYGYDRETTPFLDSLAKESLVFTRHYAVTPEVFPSHASVLSGCDPRIANRPLVSKDLGASLFLPRSAPRLARTFLANGYRTAAFSDDPGFSATHGFESGFEEFLNFREGEMDPSLDFGMAGVSIRFKRWLRGLGENENWFAYLHVRDLERIWLQEDPANDRRFAPRSELDFVPPLSANNTSFHAVPKRRWNGGAFTLGEYQARYEGNLRECDQNLGRVMSWLRNKGYWETTTLVVIGTYGISFGEEGLLLESRSLAEHDLRVPWIVRPAPNLRVPVPLRVDELTSTLDIAPTLIELCGLKRPRGMHGISLRGAVFGQEQERREQVFAAGGLFDGFAVVTRDEHFVWRSADTLEPDSLRRSYFGARRGSNEGEEAYFVDAREPRTGRMLDLADERVEVLWDAGSSWFQWIKQAQLALQGGEVDEQTVAELVRRDLVANQDSPSEARR